MRRAQIRTAAAGLVAVVLTTSGCGQAGTGPNPGSAGAGSGRSGCASAFPAATGTADLADVTLRPASFPDPPVQAVLCQTASVLAGAVTTASYATTATADEVLDGYEELLSADHDVERATPPGLDELLLADLGDDLVVQVTPGRGSFELKFART